MLWVRGREWELVWELEGAEGEGGVGVGGGVETGKIGVIDEVFSLTFEIREWEGVRLMTDPVCHVPIPVPMSIPIPISIPSLS